MNLKWMTLYLNIIPQFNTSHEFCRPYKLFWALIVLNKDVTEFRGGVCLTVRAGHPFISMRSPFVNQAEARDQEGEMMKKLLIVFVVITLFPLMLQADIYVKSREYRDAFYDGGQMVPGEDSIREGWIGDKKVELINDNVRFIIDLEAKKMTMINQNKGFYAETPVPLDLSKFLDAQFYARAQMFPTVGTVKKTEEKKKIGDWDCEKYVVETWIEYEGSKFNETVRNLWVTRDVPFDLETYKMVRTEGERLNNYGPELIERLKAVDGFQILEESITYSRGEERKSLREVLEMTEKDVPAEIFTIPEGLEKKEKLNQEDFS